MTVALSPPVETRPSPRGRFSGADWLSWRGFDTSPTTRRVPGTVPVFVLGCLVGTLASIYTVRTGTNLDYGDAMSHLTISRRILDNKAPGLKQLGTVWLPLPHLLLIPLVQSMWLFHTGVAACILGTLCLGASSAALYRIMARLEFDALGRLVGLVVLLANPSLLYVFTTALTEPVLIAAILGCIAGLAGWNASPRQLSGGELAVFAGIPAAAGVLTRYEAWPLVLSGTIFVVITTLRRGAGVRRAIAYALSFAAPSVLAISWWLAYNTATYNDPLEFLTGQYSMSASTVDFIEKGQLTTKGNFGLSFHVFDWALLETAGLAALVLAGLGLLAMTWRWGLNDKALVVWLAGTSSAFLVFSLTTGQHVMVNDRSLPIGTFNNRYVLSAVPWLALLAAFLIGHWRTHLPLRLVVTGVAIAALTAQNVWWADDPPGRMTVIQEAQIQHRAYVEFKQAATWLGQHYDGGGILMDESQSPLAPVIGVPLNEYYNRAAGDYFTEALANPYTHARWVFMHGVRGTDNATTEVLDLVTKELMADPQFHATYRLVYSISDLGIYRRIGDPELPPEVAP